MGVLREVGDGDLAVYYSHQRDPETAAHAGFPPGDRDTFIAQWATVLASPSVLTRTVLANGEVAGNIGCWQEDGRTLVGYWVARPFRGRGLATQALAEFIGVVEARPLHAYVAQSNNASIRVLEKCGFVGIGKRTGADGVEELVMQLNAAPGRSSPSS